MIKACIFDLGGTIVDRYSLTPLLSLKKLFQKRDIHLNNGLIFKDMGKNKKDHINLILNDDLILKQKQGFSVNTANLWKNYGQKICKYFLDKSRIVNDGWINPDWISKYIDKNDLEIRYINKFYGLLAFEIWYRLFVTKEMRNDEKLII